MIFDALDSRLRGNDTIIIMKILLLNPPGKRNYLRDYYCTSISKSDYYYHPVDLLYLSGTLSLEHEVDVYEALAGDESVEDALEQIRLRAPDVVVSLVAAASFDEDFAFLSRLKEEMPQVRLVGTGDIFREYHEKVFQLMPFLEATLVDFSTDDFLQYLRGAEGKAIQNVIYRFGEEIIAGKEVHGNGRFSIPKPNINLFDRSHYSFPFVRQEPFMTVLSDFGCAYSCTFCPISTLGFKMRSIEEVMQEIQQLWDAGYREIHFRDQTFGVNVKRTKELCVAIGKQFPHLTWSCFSRVDVLDEDRVKVMAENGCHTVIVGIEFDDDELQKELKKNINRAQMFKAVEVCHTHKMRIAGTFIVGLPEQNEASILRTGELARQLDLDFASFNLAIPRLGTTWRKKLIDEGSIDEKNLKMDTVEGTGTFLHAKISQARLNELREQVEREFYFRPSYIIKRLSTLRTPSECRTLWRNGVSLLAKRATTTHH